ncbi:MAG: segregation/condensation protein A [Actinomycetota bacterium]|nr:segregation/condensation protein A [Actinomycetota bacterium]
MEDIVGVPGRGAHALSDEAASARPNVGAGNLRAMAYAVTTPVFEGPFDLLLHLITREEVDIYQVSLSVIVDEYLGEMERMGPLNLERATEFLVIAAVLVELKSRRLLPGRNDPELDEELAWVEERDLLLARLLECKTFRDAGVALARLGDVAGLSHPRTAGPEERYLTLRPDLLAGVTPDDIRRAYLQAAAPRPAPRVDVDHVAPIRVSVHEVIEELAESLPARGSVTFRSLTAGITAPIEMIVRFLAVLELYKDGRVDLQQAERFGELEIIWMADPDEDA